MGRAKRRTNKTVNNRGRRPLSSPKIDRTTILQRGLLLASSVPLQDLSVVRIASELGVTAASIRYHLRGRDALTAGIVNMFYRHLLANWPPRADDWRTNVSGVAELIYRSYLRYPGVAAYFAAENRFRILASAIRVDRETMALFMERYLSVIRQVGLDIERSTTYAVILLQLLHMAAHATARHQWPGEHKLLEKHLRGLEPATFPNTVEMRDSYLSMEGETAFKAVLHLVLSGLEREQSRIRPAKQPA